MTDLNTIATTIDLALKRGITGEQAINLLRQIREQIREGQPPSLARKLLTDDIRDETYNGWKNRATWNVHLWLTGNDCGTYQIATTVARRGGVETAALAIEALCREGWGSRTPDDLPLDQVDWDHIAKALRE